MGLRDEDIQILKRAAVLLAADHAGADSRATVLAAQMIEASSHYRTAGAGSTTFWAGAARVLGKSIIAYAEEQEKLDRKLGKC